MSNGINGLNQVSGSQFMDAIKLVKGPSMSEVQAATEAEAKDAIMSILGGGAGVSASTLLYLLQKRINDIDGQIASLMKRIEVRTAKAKKLQEVMTKMRTVQAALIAKGGDKAKKKLNEFDVEGKTAYEYIKANGLEEYFDYSSGNIATYSRAIELAEKNDGVLTKEMWDAELKRQRDRANKHGRPRRRKDADRFGKQAEQYPIDFSKGPVSAEDLRRTHAKAKFNPDAKLDKHAVDQSIEKLQSQIRTINSGNELDMIELQSAMQQRSQQINLASNMIKSIHDAERKITDNTR